MDKISVSTLCTSKPEFITRFGPFLDETTIFFASRLPLVVGQQVAFAICLKDRQPMLEGDGRIIEVQALPGQSGRSGLKILVRALTAESLPTREAILAARRARVSAPASRPAPPVVPARPPVPPPPVTVVPPPPIALVPPVPRTPAPTPPPIAPVPAPPASITQPYHRAALRTTGNVLPLVPPGERRQGASDTLPANPFADVSASALSFYIESNLVESDEPHQVDGPSREDADLDSPVLHRSFLVRVLSWRAPSTLPPAVRIVVPMAGSSLLTLLLCWALWGRAPHSTEVARAPATAARSVPAPPSLPMPARAPAPAPRRVPAAASPPAAVPAELPATAGCLVRIVSRPAGALVTLGKRRLGKTPLQGAAVPCGRQTFTVSHARYRTTEEVVEPTPGTTASSLVRLARPPARLTLTSTPAGATFRVNRTQVGRSPDQASVLRFERARIEARLPGYHPWRQTIYVAAPALNVNATLVPLRSKTR